MLKLENLCSGYGNVRVLREVSLEVEEGEIFTVLGPNGAGKSTLLKTLSGLLKPSSGLIEFRGTRLNGTPPHKIVQMGVSLVPEGRRVFPLMSVRENLEMGGYLYRRSPQWGKTLERIHRLFPVLDDRQDQLAGSLSGGEQQMLAIARALMSRPRFLLLDEPSLGLAPLVIREIQAAIADINREGTTILLVEQNVHVALQLAHRGCVLETGEIVLTGRADDLRKNELVRKTYLGE